MEYVDYQKLAEQYASFLVAIGGVSITVLALVLNLNAKSGESDESTEGDPRSFMVTALVVAALSCFVGAQMMAETAAFTNYTEPVKTAESTNDTEAEALTNFKESKEFTRPTKKADRLFLLASGNIFIAIALVFFALTFLPLTSNKVDPASFKPITILFFVIVAGALYWAVLAGQYRMIVRGRETAIWDAVDIATAWAFIFWYRRFSGIKFWRFSLSGRKFFLWATFAPSALLTIISLAWFAWIYTNGRPGGLKDASIHEVRFFAYSIAISYASLIVAGLENMLVEQTTDEKGAPEQCAEVDPEREKPQQNVSNLPDNPGHEQKQSKEQRAGSGSKRTYITALLLLASIFITSKRAPSSETPALPAPKDDEKDEDDTQASS